MRVASWATVFLIAVFGFSWCSSSQAQSTNEAGLRGTISDASGNVIPGAHIALTNVATNVAQKSNSDGAGNYNFKALPPATYKMLIEANGFGAVENDNIVLTVDQQATL